MSFPYKTEHVCAKRFVHIIASFHPGNHEVELFRACFILGGLQSLSVSSGTYTLGPGNGLAKLIVPNEALSQNKELGIRYATLLDGPFYIPEGYYIVSSVLYIDYDTCLVNKPFELLLNHWYAGKDRQKTMTFLKASHVANKDDLFHFEKFGRGLFSEEQQFGVLKLHDHLCLICCAVERTHQFYPPMTCRIVMLTKQVETDIVLFALYLTFDDAAWIKVSNQILIAAKLASACCTEAECTYYVICHRHTPYFRLSMSML